MTRNKNIGTINWTIEFRCTASVVLQAAMGCRMGDMLSYSTDSYTGEMGEALRPAVASASTTIEERTLITLQVSVSSLRTAHYI